MALLKPMRGGALLLLAAVMCCRVALAASMQAPADDLTNDPIRRQMTLDMGGVRRFDAVVHVTRTGRAHDVTDATEGETQAAGPIIDAVRRQVRNSDEKGKHIADAKEARAHQHSLVAGAGTSGMKLTSPNRGACSASLLRQGSAQKKPSVLLLGSSVDRKALVEYCNHSHGDLRVDEKFVNPLFVQNEPRICTTPDVDMAYLFVPGSGPPPYWGCEKAPHLTCGNHSSDDGSVQHAKTEDIVAFDAVDFATRHLGSAPSLIIVESSLWDLARWWRNDGQIQHINWQDFRNKSEGYIQRWCTDEVPTLLYRVQRAFPDSCVAFRTPPTVNLMSIGQSPEALESMSQCIRRELKDKYLLIDYHQMVDDMVREGTPLSSVLPDGRHPGPEASFRYLDLAKGLAAGSINAEQVSSHWSTPA